MNDELDILSALAEFEIGVKDRPEVIADAISDVCSKPITLMTGSGIEYAVNQSEFEQWLVDKQFMPDFEIDDIPLVDMKTAVYQAAISFVSYGNEF